MVALPPVANTLKVLLTYSLVTDANVTSKHYFTYSGGPPSASDCANLATSIAGDWGTYLKPLLSTSYELTTVTVEDLNTLSGASGIDTPNTAGTRSGSINPIGLAALINWKISRRYRGGKPKTFAPFGVNADTSNNFQWSSTFANAVTSDYNSFIAAVAALSSGSTNLVAHVNVSYYQGYNPPVTLPSGKVKQTAKVRSSVPTPDVITTGTCNLRYSSQRRRTRAA